MFPIPQSSCLIDSLFSKTQRKTPTIIRQHFSIQRIRKFYIRKVKFVQQNFENHICKIIKFFPMIDQIHKFYNSLFNILFHRDYYKIALSRLNNSKTIVGKISTNYIRLLKHSGSLYSCKNLKKIALGRICTIIKKLDPSFIYLEKIRIQIKSIPQIDPYRISIILTGSSNSGKSSILNKMTKANVVVNSTHYLTKSLQVGHFIKNFIKWQIIDTPAIRNLKFYKYNSIEMQTLNTFVYLDNIIIYIFDPVDKNQVTLFRQIEQFKSIVVLKKLKKKIFLLGKTDLEWESIKNKEKKTYISIIFRLKSIKSDILKISAHDEVGFLSLYDKICKFDNKKKINYSKQTSFYKYFLKKSYNNKKKETINKVLATENEKNDSYKKHYLPFLVNKMHKIDCPILPESKNNEKEEKIREFNNEEKYVNENFYENVEVKKNSNDLLMSQKNRILINFRNLKNM